MKIQAVITNCCGKIMSLDDVYGVEGKEDMFDKSLSFPTIDADKSEIHYCVECYTTMVVNATNASVRRKNNEDKYQEKLKEMAYLFKKFLFDRQRFEEIKKKYGK